LYTRRRFFTPLFQLQEVNTWIARISEQSTYPARSTHSGCVLARRVMVPQLSLGGTMLAGICSVLWSGIVSCNTPWMERVWGHCGKVLIGVVESKGSESVGGMERWEAPEVIAPCVWGQSWRLADERSRYTHCKHRIQQSTHPRWSLCGARREGVGWWCPHGEAPRGLQGRRDRARVGHWHAWAQSGGHRGQAHEAQGGKRLMAPDTRAAHWGMSSPLGQGGMPDPLGPGGTRVQLHLHWGGTLNPLGRGDTQLQVPLQRVDTQGRLSPGLVGTGSHLGREDIGGCHLGLVGMTDRLLGTMTCLPAHICQVNSWARALAED
jgi:hypothetical protein